MGYLTTITIYNDGCDQIVKNKEKLADILYNACSGEYNNSRLHYGNTVGLGNYANLFTVQKPRHADDVTLYLHYGNTVIDVSEIKETDDWVINAAIIEMEYRLKHLKKLRGK